MSTSENAISIVKPITITQAMVTGTDVAEDDYAEWSSGSTYALGDRVILTSTHKIYESLQNANINKNPNTETAWWIEVSPTNRWKLFDTSNSTQTIQPDSPRNSFFYELELGQAVNSFAALNLTNCSEINITINDPTYGEVYNNTIDLVSLPTAVGWWNWFFGQRNTPSQAIDLNLPTYPDATIVITFTGGDNLAVGTVLFGQQQRFGLGIRYGARTGIQDYSRKETNEFGDLVLVERAFAKRANFSLFIDKAETDPLQSYLTEIRAVPCLWVGSSQYDSTIVFGFYKNFDILISYPEHSECDLEIEGLT